MRLFIYRRHIPSQKEHKCTRRLLVNTINTALGKIYALFIMACVCLPALLTPIEAAQPVTYAINQAIIEAESEITSVAYDAPSRTFSSVEELTNKGKMAINLNDIQMKILLRDCPETERILIDGRSVTP